MGSLRVGVIVVLTSCAASKSIPTSQINASYQANALPDGHVLVLVELEDVMTDPAQEAPLDDSDSVTVSFRDQQVTLTVLPAGAMRGDGEPANGTDLTALLDLDSPVQPGDVIAIAFDRDSYVSAPTSTAAFPPAADIAPVTPSPSRAQDFTFSWSPLTADNLAWFATPHVDACMTGTDGQVHDASVASVTIPANTLTGGGNSTCAADLTLRRRAFGSVDSAFASGMFEADVTTVSAFSSTP